MSQVHISEHLNDVPHSTGAPRSTTMPHSYFDELAEMGALQEFLNTYMSDEFRSNRKFRKQMLCLILDNNVGHNTQVEQELLGDLHQALHHFIEKASSCTRNPR